MQAAAMRNDIDCTGTARRAHSCKPESATVTPLPASPKGSRDGVAVGLVSYETKATPDGVRVIDSKHARLARMKQGITTAARLHSEAATKGGFRWKCWMVTLTYRGVDDWQAQHIRDYGKRLRQWCTRKGCAYRFAWVAELQARGAVHYHVLIWLPVNLTLPKSDKRGWWTHGLTRTEQVFAPIKYATKYSSKGTTEAERFPKGARLFGVGGLAPDQRLERTWWNMPRWVREQCRIEDRPYRRVGGGVVLRKNARLLSSPWVVHSVSDGKIVFCLREDYLL